MCHFCNLMQAFGCRWRGLVNIPGSLPKNVNGIFCTWNHHSHSCLQHTVQFLCGSLFISWTISTYRMGQIRISWKKSSRGVQILRAL